MKQNDIDALSPLGDYEMENIFNVFQTTEGQYFYNLSSTVQFPKDLDPTVYTTYVTGPNEHWNTISHKFYGTIKLWWLICAVNQINNPVFAPFEGMELKILRPDAIPNILAQLK